MATKCNFGLILMALSLVSALPVILNKRQNQNQCATEELPNVSINAAYLPDRKLADCLCVIFKMAEGKVKRFRITGSLQEGGLAFESEESAEGLTRDKGSLVNPWTVARCDLNPSPDDEKTIKVLIVAHEKYPPPIPLGDLAKTVTAASKYFDKMKITLEPVVSTVKYTGGGLSDGMAMLTNFHKFIRKQKTEKFDAAVLFTSFDTKLGSVDSAGIAITNGICIGTNVAAVEVRVKVVEEFEADGPKLIAHEIGHLLGMDNSQDGKSIMAETIPHGTDVAFSPDSITQSKFARSYCLSNPVK